MTSRTPLRTLTDRQLGLKWTRNAVGKKGAGMRFRDTRGQNRRNSRSPHVTCRKLSAMRIIHERISKKETVESFITVIVVIAPSAVLFKVGHSPIDRSIDRMIIHPLSPSMACIHIYICMYLEALQAPSRIPPFGVIYF